MENIILSPMLSSKDSPASMAENSPCQPPEAQPWGTRCPSCSNWSGCLVISSGFVSRKLVVEPGYTETSVAGSEKSTGVVRSGPQSFEWPSPSPTLPLKIPPSIRLFWEFALCTSLIFCCFIQNFLKP